MDKIAQIKMAETHGVLAALADNGMLKVASEEDFDFMTEKVAEALGEDYDMDVLISKTAGCEYLMDKIASEEFSLDEVVDVMEKEACAFADLGEFLMLKEAASVQGVVLGAKDLAQKAYTGDFGSALRNAGKATKDAFTATKLRDAMKSRSIRAKKSGGNDVMSRLLSTKVVETKPQSLTPGIKQLLSAYVPATAAVGGAAYGGKKLYDHFTKKN